MLNEADTLAKLIVPKQQGIHGRTASGSVERSEPSQGSRSGKAILVPLGLWCGNCDFMSICLSREQVQPLAAAGGQFKLWDSVSDDWVLP